MMAIACACQLADDRKVASAAIRRLKYGRRDRVDGPVAVHRLAIEDDKRFHRFTAASLRRSPSLRDTRWPMHGHIVRLIDIIFF